MKTIIFDFDGTLANTVDLVIDIYNEHATSFRSEPVERSEIAGLRRLGYKNAMKAKGVRWSQVPKIVRTISREMRAHMGEVQPYPGIIDLLKRLQAGGYTIGVLTSNNAELVHEFLEAHQFPVFAFVVSEKTLFGKEKALKKVLKHHGIPKEQAVYVGDEPRDVTACKKAQLPVIGVSWGFAGAEGFAEAQPDVLVHTADELEKAIHSL